MPITNPVTGSSFGHQKFLGLSQATSVITHQDELSISINIRNGEKNATTQREFLLQSILILDEQRRSMIEEQPSCAVSLSAFVGRKQNPNQILKSQSVTCQRC
jgi:hypothetical protein